MVSLYIYIFFGARLYSDALLNVFFLVMQFYGWYQWTRGRSTTLDHCSAIHRLGRTSGRQPSVELAPAPPGSAR